MPGLNKPTKIIVHHFGGTDANPLADSSNATTQDVDSWHKARWPGFTSSKFKNDKGRFYHVGYHFIIEKDGKVVQCRDITEEGAHCIGQNLTSIGICFAGNFDITTPTKAQLTAFKDLMKMPVLKDLRNVIFPHRKYATKTCFGLKLADTYFTDVLKTTDQIDTYTDLQLRVIQLLNQLYSITKNKRLSSREK